MDGHKSLISDFSITKVTPFTHPLYRYFEFIFTKISKKFWKIFLEFSGRRFI